MNKSESITELSKALVKFHSVMGKVSKDAKNPFYKNKYASLSNIIEAVTEPLNNNGLCVVQMPCNEGLTSMLIHESGEWISSTSSTPVKDETDPQKLGSAITYARRYALGAILSLNIDEDDDGQIASTPPTAPPKKVIEDGSKEFMAIVDWIINGKVNKDGELVQGTLEKAKKLYDISEDVENSLKEKIQAMSELK